ncbi:MAG: SAM-dependent methyltransferase [Alphaproteobacteria bacterium]|nr:MAG: SAM-dependent methyltransferase [Alphaproteobacteria bacterium]
MTGDRSEGWDAVAAEFIATRSDIGADVVRRWAGANLPPGASIVDVGCGSGLPIARALSNDGFAVSGIDASPRMIAAFRAACPQAPAACEAAQHSRFFDRRFDAAIAIGLVFLLRAKDQRQLLVRVANCLEAEGRFLFSAPRQRCAWRDRSTGRRSLSLGSDGYEAICDSAGFRIVGSCLDGGGNHYFDAVRVSPAR